MPPFLLPRLTFMLHEQTDNVTALRLTLRANGYSPIPVLGKKALLPEWQKKCGAGEEEITNWPVVARGMDNTGALTKYMPCADIDIWFPGAADTVEEVIRDWFDGRGTLLCRFGNTPKRALLFRTSTPFAKTAAHFKAPDGSLQKVEILGDGQQLVVDGVHPDIGQPHRWAREQSPATTRRADLPELDEAEAQALLDHISDVLHEGFGFERVPTPNGYSTGVSAGGALEPRASVDVDAALAAICYGKIHETWRDCAGSLLRRGMNANDVFRTLLAATENSPACQADPKKKLWGRGILDMLESYMRHERSFVSCLSPAMQKVWNEHNRAGTKIKFVWRTDLGLHIRGVDLAGTAQGQGSSSAPPNAGSPSPHAPGAIRAIPFVAFDEAKLPPREWLYASHYQRGQVTATIGPGGAGKSSLDLVEAVAMATGRNLLGEQPTLRCRVWVHNGDDDKKEMDRSIAAVCRHYKIPLTELEGWLFVTSKSDTDIKLGVGNGTLTTNRDAIDAIQSTILQNQIDVFTAEPLVTLHGVPENNNTHMNAIVHLLGGIADSCDCAIEICHHTRKLLAGNEEYNTDDGRGASAIRDAVRGSRVLNTLSRNEAQDAGIEEQERAFFFRIDRGKANYLPPAAKATWRKFENVELLNGDQVGVVSVWEFPGRDGAPASPEREAAAQKARHIYLQLLDRFTLDGRVAGDRPSKNYAPTLFALEPEAKMAKVGKVQLEEAQRRLFADRVIRVETYGRPGRPSTKIVRSN
jgi:RecA-family ATPase